MTRKTIRRTISRAWTTSPGRQQRSLVSLRRLRGVGGAERLDETLVLLAEASRCCVAAAVRLEKRDHAERATALALHLRHVLVAVEQLHAEVVNGARAGDPDPSGHDWAGHVALIPAQAAESGPPAGS